MIAGADQRGAEEQVGQPAQLLQRRCQLLVTLLRRLHDLGGELAFDTLAGVLYGGLFGERASADVLTLDAAVDAPRTRVVAASATPGLPGHAVLPSRCCAA
jgi:hypothetical protein